MKQFNFALALILTFTISCNNEDNPNQPVQPQSMESGFSVNEHYILKDGQPFEVKGVVYVPGYPGFLPWEIERNTSLPDELESSIFADISNIKAMGANTVRFWGAPKYCYEALRDIGGLHFLQTIWIDGEAPDFQDPTFKTNTKAYIRQVIDRVYSAFPDKDPPLVAWIIGNELSELSIRSTNAAHTDITYFNGEYIVTDSSINASEAFLAEMADYARIYECENYGKKSLLSYSNDIRTFGLIDVPFHDFISHNAYSYAVPYYRPFTNPGSSSGTLFQGWIEEIKARNPEIPLLITETGLSVSPNATHIGPPNYGYGGNTEEEQAAGLLQNISDIRSTSLPTAGVCIHEYLDAWWKFSLEDSYTQDPDDIEEWFGIVKLKESNDWYSTEYRPSYDSIRNRWQ